MRVFSIALILSVGLVGCSPPTSEYRVTATVKDLMDAVVDPSSDALWDAVEVIATPAGVEHKQPRTDEEWMLLRRHAITLVEASNLLLIPGRHVAKAGQTAEDATVDLHPEEIEARLLRDPAAWARYAHGLHDAALESLKAIDAKDVNALLNAGETLDASCESCHRNYWYRVAPADPSR